MSCIKDMFQTTPQQQSAVDTRISKYENKLKETDELAYELYMIESQNSRYAKRKSKAKMSLCCPPSKIL